MREEPGYIGVFAKKKPPKTPKPKNPGNQSIKTLLLIKENQVFQVNEFGACHVWNVESAM